MDDREGDAQPIGAEHAEPQARRTDRYWAFISYSHRDADTARRVHEWLETYRVPEAFVGKATTCCEQVPARLYPVFLDRLEAPGGADLSGTISAALFESRNLVVLSSPASAASRYVGNEIEYFRGLGRSARLFPVVVRGEPFAANATDECLHAAIRGSRDAGEDGHAPGALTSLEPLCCDVREHADGFDRAMLKLVSGLTGIALGDLVDRESRRRTKRHRITFSLLTTLVAVLSVLSVWALRERDAAAAAAASELTQRKLAEAREVEANDARKAGEIQRVRAVESAASARAERDRANDERLRAEREAAIARSAKLAAESQLASNAGPREISLAIASRSAHPTLESHQALVQANLRHLGDKRYVGQAPELLDNWIGPWFGNGDAILVMRRSDPTGGSNTYAVATVHPNDAGVGQMRRNPLPINGRGLVVPAAEHGVELLGIDSKDGSCLITVLSAGGLKWAFPVPECVLPTVLLSRNGRFVAVWPEMRPPGSTTARPIRVYSIADWAQASSAVPVRASDGAPLLMDPYSSKRGVSDDGRQILIASSARLWIVDAMTGRSEPLTHSFDANEILEVRVGPPGVWWTIRKLGGGIERIQAWHRTDAGWVPRCEQDVAPFRADRNVVPYNVDLLLSQTYQWSRSRASVAAVSVAAGTPTLHWCHAMTGRKFVQPLAEVPAAAVLSKGDRFLAWAVGTKVHVVDLASGLHLLEGSVGFALPVQRLWFADDAGYLMAISTNGQLTRWVLPRDGPRALPSGDGIAIGVPASLGVDPLARSGQFLQTTDSGRFVLAWNLAGRAAVVEQATGRFRTGDWLSPDATQVRTDQPADVTLKRCIQEEGHCPAVDGLVRTRQVNDDGDLVVRLDDLGDRVAGVQKRGLVLRDRDASLGNVKWSLSKSFGNPVDVKSVTGPGAPRHILLALTVPEEAIKALEERRVATSMVQLKARLASEIDGQVVYEADVAVRARGGEWRGNEKGFQLAAFDSTGRVVGGKHEVVGSVAWAAAPTPGIGTIAYPSSTSTLAVCPLLLTPHSVASGCRTIELGIDEPLDALALSRDARILAAASPRGIKVWAEDGSMLTREPIQTTGRDGTSRQLGALALSPDGRYLYTLDQVGDLRIWPMAADLLVRRLSDMVEHSTKGRSLRTPPAIRGRSPP